MRRWLLGLLVIATVVVASSIITGLARAHDRQPRASDVPAVRGGGILRPRSPVGRVDRVIWLSWNGPVSVAEYRVEIRDDRGAMLHEQRVRQRGLALPAAVRDRLRPGVQYQWQVSRLGDRGNVLDASQPATFTINPPHQR
jgi:hypothetical protein